MNNLQQYGWNDTLIRQKQASNFRDFAHGRVVVTHKTCYEIITEEGLFTCELSGNMLFAKEPSQYPCTGDWIIFQPIDTNKGIIFDQLPRTKTLYRQKSGEWSEQQAIATHVDKAFIVQSLDNSFNVRRIERFLVQLALEGIEPILVLTKADLTFDRNEVSQALAHLTHKMELFYTSIDSPESIDTLRQSIQFGETVVMVGMSGMGKSTLINALCGQNVLQTGEMSDATGKGKHTSTRREMVPLPNSGIVIDTPGVKLFGITNSNTETLSELLDLSDYEQHCRFKDCQHINEKGCAIIEALQRGEIQQGVYDNFLKLRREAWHHSASRHEKRKKEKSLSKLIDEVKLLKDNQ